MPFAHRLQQLGIPILFISGLSLATLLQQPLVAVAGIVTLPDGSRCEGDFQEGQLNGQGVCSYSNGNRYEGEFRDGLRNGPGIQTFPNGDRYEGEFRDGVRNGKGVFIFANGDRYDGEFRNGKRNGVGRFIFANGDRYKGEFRDNRRNGVGRFTFANGDYYEGQYRDNKRNGRGTIVYANGDRFEGEFRDGKRNGRGIFTFANGDRIEGIWTDDELSNEIFDQLEQSRNREFLDYLQASEDLVARNISVAETQKNFQRIAEQTGQQFAIIYVDVRPNQLDLILIPPVGTPIIHELTEVTERKLFRVVKEFRNRTTDPLERENTRYLASAQQLYQWLIAPLAGSLAELEVDSLMFSMDAGLRSLPIAALHDGNRFLVERYNLSLIPSFSLISSQYESLEDAQVLAMGASNFRDVSYPPLPAVPVELQTIVPNLWPGKSFLDKYFTLKNLRRQHRTAAFRVIHLATHAEFQPGSPENSYIQLQKKRVSMDELKALKWEDPPVDLLVLSACRTAIGDREAELGFAGLTIQSGVKSALASLWYVSDQGTLGLMTEFYYHLRQASIKAAALQQAQIAMLRGNVWIESGELRNDRTSLPLPEDLALLSDQTLSHPYYWAGFTMIGSPL